MNTKVIPVCKWWYWVGVSWYCWVFGGAGSILGFYACIKGGKTYKILLHSRAPTHQTFTQMIRSNLSQRVFVWVKIWGLEPKFATNFDSWRNCVLRSLFSDIHIVKWCGILSFLNLPSAENTYSASNFINQTHFPKWFRLSAKSLQLQLKKQR